MPNAQRPSCTPLDLVTLGSFKRSPKQATSDSLAVSAHFGEQLHAPHGIDQVRLQAGNLWSTTPGKRCWLAFKDLFPSRWWNSERSLTNCVYTSCECIFDCVHFNAELGSLLVILSFVCFEEPYRWRITIDAKDVGFSKFGVIFFRAPNCLGW